MTAYFIDDPPEFITSSPTDDVPLHGSSAKSILISRAQMSHNLAPTTLEGAEGETLCQDQDTSGSVGVLLQRLTRPRDSVISEP